MAELKIKNKAGAPWGGSVLEISYGGRSITIPYDTSKGITEGMAIWKNNNWAGGDVNLIDCAFPHLNPGTAETECNIDNLIHALQFIKIMERF